MREGKKRREGVIEGENGKEENEERQQKKKNLTKRSVVSSDKG